MTFCCIVHIATLMQVYTLHQQVGYPADWLALAYCCNSLCILTHDMDVFAAAG